MPPPTVPLRNLLPVEPVRKPPKLTRLQQAAAQYNWVPPVSEENHLKFVRSCSQETQDERWSRGKTNIRGMGGVTTAEWEKMVAERRKKNERRLAKQAGAESEEEEVEDVDMIVPERLNKGKGKAVMRREALKKKQDEKKRRDEDRLDREREDRLRERTAFKGGAAPAATPARPAPVASPAPPQASTSSRPIATNNGPEAIPSTSNVSGNSFKTGELSDERLEEVMIAAKHKDMPESIRALHLRDYTWLLMRSISSVKVSMDERALERQRAADKVADLRSKIVSKGTWGIADSQTELSGSLSSLHDRFEDLSKSHDSTATKEYVDDGKKEVLGKVTAVDNQMKSLLDRMKSAEDKMELLQERTKLLEDDTKAARDKMKVLGDKQKLLEDKMKGVDNKMESVGDRVKAVEDKVDQAGTESNAAFRGVSDRMDDVERKVKESHDVVMENMKKGLKSVARKMEGATATMTFGG
ncbi:hypothetical protein CI109_105895 [Kwoniella shandongensis]|uniref:Uncharacterized protein n=1 Tax=Kwoniella shandongensis TaxID=1734106 RepID=A0AAJ8MXT5_9TREE